MKKLMLVLLVVALAAILLVGCTPAEVVTPVTTAGIDCPTTVKVSGEVVIGTKKYLKGGAEQTITVTFAVATAPVAVYVGADIKDSTVPTGAKEVVMYTEDNKIYTGTYTFDADKNGVCAVDYIYVETCGTCAACKYPYTVDSAAPTALIKICAADCAALCGGCAITFTSTSTTAACTETANCIETCSGLATWNIDIYSGYNPACCTTACAGILIGSGSGTACPISWTTACLSTDTADKVVYAIITLADKVGNSLKYGYKITQTWINNDTCSTVTVENLASACLTANDNVPCNPCVNNIVVQ